MFCLNCDRKADWVYKTEADGHTGHTFGLCTQCKEAFELRLPFLFVQIWREKNYVQALSYLAVFDQDSETVMGRHGPEMGLGHRDAGSGNTGNQFAEGMVKP